MEAEPPTKVRKQLSGFRQAKRQDSKAFELEPDAEEPNQKYTLQRAQADTVDAQADASQRGQVHSADKRHQLKRQPTVEDVVQEPGLSSAEDLLSDQNLHSTLRLATGTMSWKWLRRLPPALQCQRDLGKLSDPVRASALEMCKASLQCLLTDEAKAVAWLTKTAASLGWYELEGPTRGPEEEENEVRKVREWNEAYRSLWLLLRQGALPAFCIEAERFSVMVFGDGGGTWTSPANGQQVKPSRSEPCAILWPSSRELRSMLQENHVYFDMPHMPPRTLQRQTSAADAPKCSAGDGTSTAATNALVPLAKGSKGMEVENSVSQTRQDLLELRRDGERAKAPGDGDYDFAKTKSALCFQGAWRVHLLVNVLRQHFLGHPMSSAVKMRGAKKCKAVLNTVGYCRLYCSEASLRFSA